MSDQPGIQIITAASILGLKPSGVEKLADALLAHGLKSKLRASDSIIHIPTLNHLYSDRRDKQTDVLNSGPLRNFSIEVHNTIKKILVNNKFMLVLGGDCSILIGIMSALKSSGHYGLLFMDAHADFYEPEKSITGEAADMDLALVTGRGPEVLTNISNLGPYVRDADVIHIGQRDMEETIKYNSQDIRLTGIKCFDETFIQGAGVHKTFMEIDSYVENLSVDGFWIHFDTDVIEDESNPAVDYRLPGGLSFAQCELLLTKLIGKYPTIGMSVTILNPTLDKDKTVVEKLTALLASVLA